MNSHYPDTTIIFLILDTMDFIILPQYFTLALFIQNRMLTQYLIYAYVGFCRLESIYIINY